MLLKNDDYLMKTDLIIIINDNKNHGNQVFPESNKKISK